MYVRVSESSISRSVLLIVYQEWIWVFRVGLQFDGTFGGELVGLFFHWLVSFKYQELFP